uniref:Uncharacterized protein n=1 Tax=Rhizophora mucronata TaxID=61149 RepID=A0A2P2PVH6_RHIMU
MEKPNSWQKQGQLGCLIT